MTATPSPNEIVREFYKAFEEPIHEGAPSVAPEIISDERLELKIALIVEEVSELLDATYSDSVGSLFRNAWKHAVKTGMTKNPKRDFVEMFDAAIDIDVVVNGLAIETNMPVAAGHKEVLRGNLSKLGEDGKPLRSDGVTPASDGEVKPKNKIIKGPNYVAPDLLTVLREHGYEG